MESERLAELLDGVVLGVALVSVKLELSKVGQVLGDGGGEELDGALVELAVLELEALKLGVGAVSEGGSEGDTSRLAEQAVGEVEVGEVGPVLEDTDEGAGAGASGSVVLEVEVDEVLVVREALGERLNALHADTVLGHADLLEATVGRKRLSPDRGRAVLETRPSAHNGAELARLALLLQSGRELEDRTGDDLAALGAETSVVELNDLVDVVVLQERGHRIGAAAAESIVREVELDQTLVVDERIAQRRQSLRDLRDQATGEDVGEVNDLVCQLPPFHTKLTLRLFFSLRTAARASHASTPRELPPK